jgi:hypothetical protein
MKSCFKVDFSGVSKLDDILTKGINMQISVSIDEELHKQLLELSRKQGTTLPELTRSALRALCPDVQKITVQAIDKNNKISKDKLEVNAKISELHGAWFGTFEVARNDLQKITNPMSPGGPEELWVVTENGRKGSANLTGFSGSGGGPFGEPMWTVDFVGSAGLK